MNRISIEMINKYAKKINVGNDTKIILMCEFISSQNLDEKFQCFLDDKEKKLIKNE